MNNSDDMEKFGAQVGRYLFDSYLPFWSGPALDHENGGWMAWLSNDLTPDRTKPKGLIVNARILWAFSAAHRARPEPIFAEMAERAFDVIMNQFWDIKNGGGYWQLDDAGKVLDDSKKIYGQAFIIYALSEFHQAFGSHAALIRAEELFELIERHAHDRSFGGYVEVCRCNWTEAGPEARLSARDMNEKKSMNNHLHVLEAYTNFYRIQPQAPVANRIRELIDLFLNRILDSHTWHLHHFFDERWRVRSDSYTFGHDVEASWLLCEAAEALRDESLLKQVQAVAIRMVETVLAEALASDGGLYYEGKNGSLIDLGRECWPQAEAMVGFLNAFEISEAKRYFSAATRVWDYIQSNLMDRTHGEWFWRIAPDGRPDQTLPKVSEWKGPYHVTRACLEVLRRVERISTSQSR